MITCRGKDLVLAIVSLWGIKVLCACSRCTGYRPILDAFRVFAKAEPSAYTEEAITASQAANGHANGHSNGVNGHTNGHTNGISPASSSDLSTNGAPSMATLFAAH